jgi:hypothetical protein
LDVFFGLLWEIQFSDCCLHNAFSDYCLHNAEILIVRLLVSLRIQKNWIYALLEVQQIYCKMCLIWFLFWMDINLWRSLGINLFATTVSLSVNHWALHLCSSTCSTEQVKISLYSLFEFDTNIWSRAFTSKYRYMIMNWFKSFVSSRI